MNKFRNIILKYENNISLNNLEEIAKKLEKVSLKDVLDFHFDAFNKIFKNDIDKKLFISSINNILSIGNSLNIKSIKSINNSKYIEGLLKEKDQSGFLFNGKECLDSIINSMKNPNWDEIMFYAVTWFRIAKNHCFKNRNKRTAFVSVKSTLVIDMICNIIKNDFIEKNFIYQNNFIKNFFDKLKNDFLKTESKKIVNIWAEKFITEDYLLSLWIISYDSKNNENKIRDKLYEVLYLNLIFFLFMNRNAIKFSVERFFKNFLNEINNFSTNDLFKDIT